MTYWATCRIELSDGAENALGCPFCAAAADLRMMTAYIGPTDGDEEQPCYMVRCDTCHARGPFSRNEREAVTLWNTRYLYQDAP